MFGRPTNSTANFKSHCTDDKRDQERKKERQRDYIAYFYIKKRKKNQYTTWKGILKYSQWHK